MYRRNIHGILDVLKHRCFILQLYCVCFFCKSREKNWQMNYITKSGLHLFVEISFNRLNFIQISPLAPVLTFVWYLYWLKPEFLMETHTSDLVTTWQTHMTTPG